MLSCDSVVKVYPNGVDMNRSGRVSSVACRSSCTDNRCYPTGVGQPGDYINKQGAIQVATHL